MYFALSLFFRHGLVSAVLIAVSLMATPYRSARASDPSDYLNLVQVDDGLSETCEYGYTGSGVNSISHTAWNIYTVEDQQFAAYYYMDPDNSGDAYNNRIIIARRTVGQTSWDILKTSLAANNVADNHDNVCFGIDGDGYMHLSWGMHCNALKYAKSLQPVTGSNPLTMGGNLGTTGMTGNENYATYPQFFKAPDSSGDLLFIYREGSSTAGDNYLNRYDASTGTWENVNTTSSGAQSPFLKGTGFSRSWYSYLNRMAVDSEGNLHLTWTNRSAYLPNGEYAYQTNHNFYYARSTDMGQTWESMDGTPYDPMPIIGQDATGANPGSVAQPIITIPEGSSLINAADMIVDKNNNPVIATWWAPGAEQGDHSRQYQVVFYDGAEWQTRQISDRTIDSPSDKKDASQVRDLARPIVLCDDDNRLLVVYRDDQDTNGITVAYTEPYDVDPTRSLWTTIELTTDNLGDYEPNYDPAAWADGNQLHLLLQAQEGQGNIFIGDASPMKVLEWDAKGYFNSVPEPGTFVLLAAGLFCLFAYRWKREY